MHAISWRNAMIVDVLLRYRADSERPDAHGKTALHKACALRDSSLKDMSSIVEIVDVLLKHRADLDAVDKVRLAALLSVSNYRWLTCYIGPFTVGEPAVALGLRVGKPSRRRIPTGGARGRHVASVGPSKQGNASRASLLPPLLVSLNIRMLLLLLHGRWRRHR